MSSGLIKITDEVYVRRSEVIAIHVNMSEAVIQLKHNQTIRVNDLTPKQVFAILEGKDISSYSYKLEVEELA